MKKELILLLIIITLSLMPNSSAGQGRQKNVIQRFVLAIGANNGGPGREKLRFAEKDAIQVLSVLRQMGGVQRKNSIILLDPDKKSFFSSMDKLLRKIIEAKKRYRRVEVFFYYSGHSDEEGILLGKEKINYKDIRDSIKRMPADIRIAILDSCSSGAFTRMKGGKKLSPFLIDHSQDMKGYAFMSSSSLDEASQESDRIKGSFFTYYIISGLRGAADMSRDGRVTLNEAYQFAYNETLNRTEKTIHGAQHPNYSIEMSGTGDVVLTEIRRSSSLLIIEKSVAGRLFIRDDNDNLIAELKKLSERDMQLGLEAGNYKIINEKDGILMEASITLKKGKGFMLTQDIFKKAQREYAMARGNEGYAVTPFSFSIIPSIGISKKTIHYYSLNLFGSYSTMLDGLSLGIGPGLVGEDARWAQINLLGNYAGRDVTGAQISSVFNYAGNNVSGAQISGVFNRANGGLEGAQISPVFNMTGGFVSGVQASAVFNYAGTDAKGAQLSAVFNYAGENLTGTQASAVFNYAGADVKGAQLSAVFNYAGADVKGTQVSALFNYSGNDYNGAQISLLNIAENFKGVQLGLVNISENQEGIPIGLVNISKNGGISITMWGSNLIGVNLGAQFRAKYIYSILSVGGMNLDRDSSPDKSLSSGFYLGVHAPLSSFYLNFDAGYIFIDNDKIFSGDDEAGTGRMDQEALQGRAIIGYNINNSISVFLGGGASYITSAEDDFAAGDFSPLFLGGVKYTVFGGN